MKNPPLVSNPPQKVSTPFLKVPLKAMPALGRRMTFEEYRLFLFYSITQANFRPSYKHIHSYTGIAEHHIASVRKRLIEKGFIDYDKEQDMIRVKPWADLEMISAAMMISGDGKRNHPANAKPKPAPESGSIIHNIQLDDSDEVTENEENKSNHSSNERNSSVPRTGSGKRIGEMMNLDALRQFQKTGETTPACEDYYINGANRLENLTEDQFIDYLENGELPF